MIRVIELFGGIGACTQALLRLGESVDVVDYVEIDKYAVKSYNAINGTDFEPKDITEWDKDFEDIDLIMHGSPCQDFSVAGKQAGGDIDSGTRSSLMYETLRIVEKIKPKYVIWENVKNILSKKHRHNFDNYLEKMKELGYANYYQVLNAKDYGIPQNRERVFTVSIRNDCVLKGTYNYGIDDNDLEPYFKFPEKEELKIRLKDILEDEVEEKYYLSERMVKFFYKNEQMQKEKGNGFRFGVSDGNVIAKTVTTRAGCRMDDNFIQVDRLGGIFDTEKSKHQAGSIYDKEGLSPSIDTMQGGYRQPMIEVIGNYSPSKHNASRIVDSNGLAPTVKENHETVTTIMEEDLCENDGNKFIIAGQIQPIDRDYNKHNSKREEHFELRKDNLSNAILTGANKNCIAEGFKTDILSAKDYRIRKLTPKECWRLMGFDDESFEKARSVGISNTQLYKQARKFDCGKCIAKNIKGVAK